MLSRIRSYGIFVRASFIRVQQMSEKSLWGVDYRCQ